MSFFRKLFNRSKAKHEAQTAARRLKSSAAAGARSRADPVAASPNPKPGAAAEPATGPEPSLRGWFSRLTEGLSKSSRSITGSITSIFTKKKLDKATLQDLEDVLLQADLGLAHGGAHRQGGRRAGRYDKEIDPEEVKRILASEVSKVLKPVEVPFDLRRREALHHSRRRRQRRGQDDDHRQARRHRRGPRATR